METVSPVAADRRPTMFETSSDPRVSRESGWSGVSWPAVLGGAFVAAAFSLILLALGAGLGLSVVSPWANVGASAATVGAMAIAWLIFVQAIASALGGYLTGRLRTRWVSTHNDEVFFRDTANGLLMWAVGLVITVAFLTTAATSLMGGASTAAAATAAGAAARSDGGPLESNGYFVDSLFRSDHPSSDKNVGDANVEAGRILANGLRQADMPPADTAYLARLVSARTGMSQPEAEKRGADVVTNRWQAADTARKAAVYLLLWIFLALLIGAFCASLFATFGGRIRDGVKVV